MSVVVDGEVVAKLERIHPAGLFEGVVEGALGDYRLDVGYPGGGHFSQRDPYAFLPTIGEIDLHLAGAAHCTGQERTPDG